MATDVAVEAPAPSPRAFPWYRVGDVLLCFLLTLFAVLRGNAVLHFAGESDWMAALHHAVVGLQLMVMAGLPLIRRRAIARAPGFMPKAIAIVGTYFILPLAMLPLTWRPDWLLTLSTIGLIAFAVFEIWALLTLRRSFSIFPEARKLITHGPYALVRHPLYAVYLCTYVLIALPRISVPAVLIAGLGMSAQVMRALREEEVLRATFPEYADYAAHVPRFIPRRWHRHEPKPAVTTDVPADDQDQIAA